MRIISKFKDYYDIGLGLGVDQSLVYVRDTKVLHQLKSNGHRSIMYSKYEVDYFVVGFCGKFYPYIVLNVGKQDPESLYTYLLCGSTIHFNMDSVSDHLGELGIEKGRKSSFWYQYSDFHMTEQHFNSQFKDIETIWVDHHTPIFLTRLGYNWGDSCDYYTTINPNLSDIEFYRAVDPYTAFQEVSMFLGGVLGSSGNPIPEVSERDRFEGKGHDFKKSFRKAPGKKKKKRRDKNG